MPPSNFASAYVDLGERLFELPGDGVGFTAFGGDLARIGEVLVEGKVGT